MGINIQSKEYHYHDDIKKDPSIKVLSYFWIISRFVCFFTNINDLVNLMCHAHGRKCDLSLPNAVYSL